MRSLRSMHSPVGCHFLFVSPFSSHRMERKIISITSGFIGGVDLIANVNRTHSPMPRVCIFTQSNDDYSIRRRRRKHKTNEKICSVIISWCLVRTNHINGIRFEHWALFLCLSLSLTFARAGAASLRRSRAISIVGIFRSTNCHS